MVIYGVNVKGIDFYLYFDGGWFLLSVFKGFK